MAARAMKAPGVEQELVVVDEVVVDEVVVDEVVVDEVVVVVVVDEIGKSEAGGWTALRLRNPTPPEASRGAPRNWSLVRGHPQWAWRGTTTRGTCSPLARPMGPATRTVRRV